MRQPVLFFAAVCLALSLTVTPARAASPLDDYIAAPDPAYQFEVVSEQAVGQHTLLAVKLTSQKWQGKEWEHWLAMVVPRNMRHPRRAILVIGGGSSRSLDRVPSFDKEEQQFISMLANATGAPIAFISNVPNQPFFGDKYEDALIAHSFDRYLETEDPNWPALLPMTKAAVRAMDTVQAVMKERGHAAPEKFIVSGASKRGWTTYLTAATDPRVLAIMPMVFDVLNMPRQIPHQQRSLGTLREKIDDYTKLRITERLSTPAGKRLVGIVDPFAYRDRLKMPKFIVLGTNDPYWSTDASSLYIDQLSGPTWLYYAPNKGHGLGLSVAPVLISFVQAVLGDQQMPEVDWASPGPGRLTVTCAATGVRATQWTADSPTRDFTEAHWQPTRLEGKGRWEATAEAPAAGYRATYVELLVPQTTGLPLRFCTTITITPDTFPR